MKMAKFSLFFVGLVAASQLAGCVEGVQPYVQSPDTVIATAHDSGRDSGVLEEGGAAIAYDPDGCQNWIIDDGMEGYSSPRYDPATGLPIGSSRNNLKAAVAGETHEYTDMYPGMAKTAREEGHDEIADWFETLAKAERSHANRYAKALAELVD